MSRAPNPIAATLVLSIAAIAVYAGLRLMPGADPDTAAGPVAAATPQMLPEFSMPDLDGTAVSIRGWPGQALIVNFWATWCAPCLREIPMLSQYQQEHSDVQVVGIALDSEDAVRRFVEDMPFSYPVLVGPGGYEAAAAFGVDYIALPLTVFVAADGRLLTTQMGEVRPEQLTGFTAANAGLADGRLDLAAAQALVELRR